MTPSRQLAAIMFTDIEGYSATMQQNEEKAIMLKDRHRLILEDEHRKFNGNIIQYYGDGTLSIFVSVIQAVQCALTMQKFFREVPLVPVRIGLHIGDIIINDGHIFGDGVNVASRIESLGVAGSVLISDKVNSELHNHPEFKTLSMGTYQFKNIEHEIEVFALDHEDLVKPVPHTLNGKLERKKNPPEELPIPKKSVAVLPFVNMSNDAEQEYLGDGIADEIIIAIAKIKELKVSSRSSSFSFKNQYEDARIIGKKLGVSNILEGSIKKSGGRLRISAQLINVDDGFQLWSDIYQMDAGDIFIIQEHIAQSITENLKLKFSPSKDEKIVDIGTQNPEAYDLYLKGRFFWNKRYKGGLQLSLTYFEKAIVKDAHFAKPYAGIADVAYILGIYGLVKSADAWGKVTFALQKAFELNPALPEAFISKGVFEGWFKLNWINSYAALRNAINLNPSVVDSHSWLAAGLAIMHAPEDEIMPEISMVLQTAPNAFFALSMCALAYGAMGESKKASDLFKKILSQDPENVLACYLNGIVSWQLKEFVQAEECLEKAVALSGRLAFIVSILSAFYGYTGTVKKSTELLEELENRSKTEYISHGTFAVAYTGTNRKKEAYSHLESGFAEKDPSTHFLLCMPLWNNIHSEDRFKKLFETYMPISWANYCKVWRRDSFD